MALLSQLLAVGSAGDVGLHAETVALSAVELGQLDHAALRDVLFLQATHLGVRQHKLLVSC